MGFSWRKTFKIKQTRKSKCLSAFDVEHAQCLTGYHVFMVSGLDLARAPRRARLTARKKGSGYENGSRQYITRAKDWVEWTLEKPPRVKNSVLPRYARQQ